MFGNIGIWEVLVIFLVVLLLFGAKRIPEIAGSMGKGIREFKKNINDAQRDIEGDSRGYTEPRLTPRDLEQNRPASEPERPEPKRLI